MTEAGCLFTNDSATHWHWVMLDDAAKRVRFRRVLWRSPS
jgi:hypothetical protein